MRTEMIALFSPKVDHGHHGPNLTEQMEGSDLDYNI